MYDFFLQFSTSFTNFEKWVHYRFIIFTINTLYIKHNNSNTLGRILICYSSTLHNVFVLTDSIPAQQCVSNGDKHGGKMMSDTVSSYCICLKLQKSKNITGTFFLASVVNYAETFYVLVP